MIAILIAMVGVVNTILMSVFERYQEFGIKKSMEQLLGISSFDLDRDGPALPDRWFTGSSDGLWLAAVTESLIRYLLPYSPKGSLVYIDEC
jgi:putative ABC transport system permease protein